MAPLAAAARRTPARWPWAFGVLLLAAALGFGWVHRPDDGPADRWPVSHTAQLAAEHGCLPPDRWSAQIFRGQLQPVGALLIQTSPGRPTQVAHVPAPDSARWQRDGWQLRQWCRS